MRSVMSKCVAASALVLTAGVSVFCAGCGPAPSSASASSAETNDNDDWQIVVEPEWLYDQWRDRAVLIVDTRKPEEYEAGHIPGAVNIPRKTTYDGRTGNTSNIAPVAQIERLFGSAGVTQRIPVVLYDDANYRDAARVFWVLEVHGHTRVAVLNGGLSGWRGLDYPVTTEPTVSRPREFVANLKPERMSSKLQVMQVLGNQSTVILDARSDEEYIGEKSVTDRAGHIPSAVHMDFQRNFIEPAASAACHLHDVEQLTELYANIPQDRQVITYCNTGTRASVSYLVLRALGRNVAVYDGSWSEWSSDPSLPIETGSDPKSQIGGGR